jgi:hypothetical protein
MRVKISKQELKPMELKLVTSLLIRYHSQVGENPFTRMDKLNPFISTKEASCMDTQWNGTKLDK